MSHYEINISKNGKHLFATAERSLTTIEEAKNLMFIFRERFYEEDGYKITITEWKKTGHNVTALI